MPKLPTTRCYAPSLFPSVFEKNLPQAAFPPPGFIPEISTICTLHHLCHPLVQPTLPAMLPWLGLAFFNSDHFSPSPVLFLFFFYLLLNLKAKHAAEQRSYSNCTATSSHITWCSCLSNFYFYMYYTEGLLLFLGFIGHILDTFYKVGRDLLSWQYKVTNTVNSRYIFYANYYKNAENKWQL